MTGARAKQASERSRHPTEIRRHLIVKAARSVIAERGLFATSVRDIAAASDVSIGTVTYHFTGITEILAEVLNGEMDSFYAPVIATAAAAPDGRSALEAIVDGFIASTPRAREHWLLWLDFWAQSPRSPGVAAVRQKSDERWRETIRSVVQAGQEAGEFASVDADDFTITLSALLDGLAVQIALEDPAVPPQRTYDLAMRFVAGQLGFDPKAAPVERARKRGR